MLSDYNAFDIQFCMTKSLHVADNFIKTVLLECINEMYTIMLYYTMTVLLEYIDRSMQFFTSFSVSLSHQGPARRPKPVEQGVTIFTNLMSWSQNNPTPGWLEPNQLVVWARATGAMHTLTEMEISPAYYHTWIRVNSCSLEGLFSVSNAWYCY